MHRAPDLKPTVPPRRAGFCGLLAGAVILLCGCAATGGRNWRFLAQESLLEIVAELKRHQYLDLYRYATPRDLSGQNVFKATLVRLANYQQLYPEKYSGLIDFARAEAYERLGDYAAARRFYLSAAVAESTLTPIAQRRIGVLDAMLELSRRGPPATAALPEWIDFLQRQPADWLALAGSEAGGEQPYLGLILLERENAERELIEFFWQNRRVIENGGRRAIELQQALIAEHPQSRRVDEHVLRLGQFYFELAREYAERYPPARGLFDANVFERQVQLARGQFYQVEREYGSVYRAEARGWLDALEAFIARVNNEAE